MSKKKQVIQPLHDRVVIYPIPISTKTASGIIIPDTAKEKPLKGVVKYCGDGFKDEPMVVKVGYNVLYGKHVGQEIIIADKPYLIMREGDILAII